MASYTKFDFEGVEGTRGGVEKSRDDFFREYQRSLSPVSIRDSNIRCTPRRMKEIKQPADEYIEKEQ